jgi:phosphotransferase system enzyme I (PtsI)
MQYTLAVDRGNDRVSYLAQPLHPALLRLIKRSIDAAHDKGIKISLCGEMASNPEFTPLLLGMGLDTFSMTLPSILPVKKIIRNVSMEACSSLAEQALAATSYHAIAALLADFAKSHGSI